VPARSKDVLTMAQPVLKIIVASVRQGRVGDRVGSWVAEAARNHGAFDLEVLDLAQINLPLMNEPNHPRLQQYTQEATKAWSRSIDGADAFVFVMPEYNYSFTAPLKNALDYVFVEWQHKPVGLVSYGGVSGGLRAAQQVKQVVTTLSMMPIVEAVTIPMVATHLKDGVLAPTDMMTQSATAMFDALVRWESALRTLRPGREDDAAKDI
jgi:NAD(P)H-dependent FMN reductase